MLGGNADPVIRDDDGYMILMTSDGDGDRPLRRRVLDGVIQQVEEEAAELFRIAHHEARRRGFEDELLTFLRGYHSHVIGDLAHKLVESQQVAMLSTQAGILAKEKKKRLAELRQVLDLLEHV